MEDDLNFFIIEDTLNFFQMEDNINCLLQMNDNLSYVLCKITSLFSMKEEWNFLTVFC